MQTSIEWLWEQIPFEFTSKRSAFEVLEQAKEMHKQEIMNAYNQGASDAYPNGSYIEGNTYYQETFKKDSSKEQQKELIKEIMDLDAKDGLYEISDEEIEAAALTFAKEESYGELSADLWKGFVFGAKWYREQLKNIDKKL